MMMYRTLPQYTNSLVIINHLVGQSDGIKNGKILMIVNASPVLRLLFGQQGEKMVYIINTQNSLLLL